MQDIVVDHDSVSIHIAAAQDFIQSETIDLPFTVQILRCGVGRKLQLDRLIVPTLPMRMLRHHRGGDHQNRRVPRIFLGLAVPLEDHFPVRIPVIRNLVVDQPVGLVDGHPAYQLPILRRQVVPQQPTRRSGETGPQRALPLVSPAFVAGIHPMPRRERGSHSHRLGDRFCFRNAGNRRIVHPEFQRHGQRERFAGHRTDMMFADPAEIEVFARLASQFFHLVVPLVQRIFVAVQQNRSHAVFQPPAYRSRIEPGPAYRRYRFRIVPRRTDGPDSAGTPANAGENQ